MARFGPKSNKIFNGADNIYYDIDASNKEALHSLFKSVNPDVVINCIGVIKQLESAQDPVITIPINSIKARYFFNYPINSMHNLFILVLIVYFWDLRGSI